jgi:hypothetical protein
VTEWGKGDLAWEVVEKVQSKRSISSNNGGWKAFVVSFIIMVAVLPWGTMWGGTYDDDGHYTPKVPSWCLPGFPDHLVI